MVRYIIDPCLLVERENGALEGAIVILADESFGMGKDASWRIDRASVCFKQYPDLR